MKLNPLLPKKRPEISNIKKLINGKKININNIKILDFLVASYKIYVIIENIFKSRIINKLIIRDF